MKEEGRRQFAYVVLTLIKDLCLIFATVLITGVIFSNFNKNLIWLGLGCLAITAVSKLILQSDYFRHKGLMKTSH